MARRVVELCTALALAAAKDLPCVGVCDEGVETYLLQRTLTTEHQYRQGSASMHGQTVSSKATKDEPKVAFTFTTSCGGEYQLYQSAVLEWSWKQVGHTGTLTRVVTGCKSAEQQKEASKSPLEGDSQFHVFTTPIGDLSVNPRTGKSYPARGRPWSLMAWLEAGLPPWTQSAPPDLVAVLDPDFAMLRPLTSHPRFKDIERGRMFASTFDMGGDWVDKFEEIGEQKPHLTTSEALEGFSSGPPWIMDRRDFVDMLPQWGEYTDKLDEQDHTLLNEQFAFLMAAAHHGISMLPDGNTLAVSNPAAYREAWTKTNKTSDWEQAYLLHYCMSVKYKGWQWHKSLVTRQGWYAQKFNNKLPGILECGSPSLAEPPPPPDFSVEPDPAMNKWAWFLHRLLPRINAGTSAFRKRYCPQQGRSDVLVRTVGPVGCKIDGQWNTATMYFTKASEPSTWANDTEPKPCDAWN